MESSAERLARFAGVERGYLAIFLVLGSLALALGSLGFAIQVFRSVQEDAPEILLLRQLGWPERRLLIRIWLEPALTWLWGGAAGTAAARLALQGQAGRTDWALWWAMAGLILGAGALAIALSGRFSRPADQARASISR
jgi:ABC-type antimicrobial peptide transport system permease subunit